MSCLVVGLVRVIGSLLVLGRIRVRGFRVFCEFVGLESVGFESVGFEFVSYESGCKVVSFESGCQVDHRRVRCCGIGSD